VSAVVSVAMEYVMKFVLVLVEVREAEVMTATVLGVQVMIVLNVRVMRVL
jgi:hypothetical protein